MAMTLEEFGASIAQQKGLNPSDPQIKAKIDAAVADLRSIDPNASDQQIIDTHGAQIQQELVGDPSAAAAVEGDPDAAAHIAMDPAQGAPDGAAAGGSAGAAPVGNPAAPDVAPQSDAATNTPNPGALPANQIPAVGTAQPDTGMYDKYQTMVGALNKNFGADAQQKVVDQSRLNNVGNEIARNLSLTYRVNSTPEANKVLDQAYAENTATGNRPYADWAAKKAQAVAEIQQMIQGGELKQEDVKAQLQNLGLQQALDERRTKQIQTQAENDPNSATSDAYRHLTQKYAPQLATSLGDKFNTLTAAQLKTALPNLEKQYDAMITQQSKDADRASREKIAAGHDAATLGKTAVSQGLASQRQAAGLSTQQRAEQSKAEGAQETLQLLDRADALIKGGLSTGPQVGGDGIVGSVYKQFSDKKQEADNIVAQLVGANAKMFGGAPSDKEGQLIKQSAAGIFQMDHPENAIAAMRARAQRTIDEAQANVKDIGNQKSQVLNLGGQPSNSPSPRPFQGGSVPTVNDEATYNSLPSGATYIDGRDGKTKIKG